ncbi:MAG: hypothetical protein WCG95_08135 [bacterium]
MLRTCPYSGENFNPKRRNQIFSSAKNRQNYHNDRAAELRVIKAPIAKAIDRNLQILTQLVGKDAKKIIKSDLLASLGFNHNVFTHLEMYEGKNCRGIFHFIIPPSNSIDYITIINKAE